MNPGVGVPVSDNYQPNGSLPLWSPGGEGIMIILGILNLEIERAKF